MAGAYFVDTQLTYRAATAKGRARIVRELPKGMRKRFKEMVEGIMIPHGQNRKFRFLDAIGCMADNCLGMAQMKVLTSCKEVPGDIVEEELVNALRLFGGIRRAAELAYSSSKPLEYMEMLARSPYCADDFISSMGLFVERSPMFADISAEAVALSHRIASAIVAKPPEAALDLVPIVRAQLPGLGICLDDGKMTDAEVHYVEGMAIRTILNGFHGAHIMPMVDAEYPVPQEEIGLRAKLRAAKLASMQTRLSFGMMLGCGNFMVFDNGSFVGVAPISRSFSHGAISAYLTMDDSLVRGRLGAVGVCVGPAILVLSEEPRIIHHELQHVFDSMIGLPVKIRGHEYRARLAELAFSPDPGHVAKMIASTLKGMMERGCRTDDDGMTMAALADVYRKVMVRSRSNDDLAWIARGHLESAYVRAINLSYDGIVEPFRKR